MVTRDTKYWQKKWRDSGFKNTYYEKRMYEESKKEYAPKEPTPRFHDPSGRDVNPKAHKYRTTELKQKKVDDLKKLSETIEAVGPDPASNYRSYASQAKLHQSAGNAKLAEKYKALDIDVKESVNAQNLNNIIKMVNRDGVPFSNSPYSDEKILEVLEDKANYAVKHNLFNQDKWKQLIDHTVSALNLRRQSVNTQDPGYVSGSSDRLVQVAPENQVDSSSAQTDPANPSSPTTDGSTAPENAPAPVDTSVEAQPENQPTAGSDSDHSDQFGPDGESDIGFFGGGGGSFLDYASTLPEPVRRPVEYVYQKVDTVKDELQERKLLTPTLIGLGLLVAYLAVKRK